jgi:hypothetical protein
MNTQVPEPKETPSATRLEALWWVKLVVAVLAVGSLAAAASLILTDNEWLQVALFVSICWGCVWASKGICANAGKNR